MHVLLTYIFPNKNISWFCREIILILAIYQVKTLFDKLWPLMRLRAELDLRLTKSIMYFKFMDSPLVD